MVEKLKNYGMCRLTVCYLTGGVISDLLLYKTNDNSQYGDSENYYFYKDFVIISSLLKIDILDIKSNIKITTINNSILFFDELNGFVYYYGASTLYRFNLNDFTTKNVGYDSGLSSSSDYREGSRTITSKAIILKQGNTVNVIDMGLNLVFSNSVYSSVSGFSKAKLYALSDGKYLFEGDYYNYKLLDSSFREIKYLNLGISKVVKILNDNIYAIDSNGNLCKFTYYNSEVNAVWKSSAGASSNTNYDDYRIVGNDILYITRNKTMIFDINNGVLKEERTSDFFTRFTINGKDSLMIHREQYAKNVLLMKGNFDKIKTI